LEKKQQHYVIDLAPELTTSPTLLRKLSFFTWGQGPLATGDVLSSSSSSREQEGEVAMEVDSMWEEEEEWVDVDASSVSEIVTKEEPQGEQEKEKNGRLPRLPSTTELLLELLQLFYPQPKETAREGGEEESRKEEATDAFVDAMLAELPAVSKRQRTENGAIGFSSSDNALLDFFFQVFGETAQETVNTLLNASWRATQQQTLQAIAQLRDVREGKAERGVAYYALLWLYENHPQTLIVNLPAIAKLGYWKDLNTLLVMLATGGEVRWEAHKKRVGRLPRVSDRKKAAFNSGAAEKKQLVRMYELQSLSPVRQAKVIKAKKREEKTSTARSLFNTNKRYRALHTAIAIVYASQLQRDLNALRRRGSKAVSSLAAKWAPSPGKHEDEHTLLASSIALLLYRNGSSQSTNEGETSALCADRARRRYAKEFLTPLRRAAGLTETLMSAGKWEEIDYRRVPSVCMKNQKESFQKHDGERFQAYLRSVAQGKEKINSRTLMPHDIISDYLNASSRVDEVQELQWKAYVDHLKQSGSLSRCLAVVDVSGSMAGLPMQVAIALGLLVCECTLPPFQGLVCTFSKQPSFVKVPLDSPLSAKVNKIRGMDWGMNTNFHAVFKLILQKAQAARLKPEEMVQKLFVFSDMEFDQAAQTTYSANRNATMFELIKSEFEEKGYELPQIIFWNLRATTRSHGGGVTVPVRQDASGAALVSGCSGNLLKLFCDGNLQELTPSSVLKKAIERYSTIVKVVD